MRSTLCLVLLILSGIALITVPTSRLALPTEVPGATVLNIWINALKAFGIPLALLLLQFTRTSALRRLYLIYGTVMTGLTLLVVWGLYQNRYFIPPDGQSFSVAVLVVSLGLVLSSSIPAGRSGKKKNSKPASPQLIQKKSA